MARDALRPSGMRYLTNGILGVLLLGVLARTVAAATEGTNALQLCGTLKEHHAATATTTGSLILGSRTYVVATGAQAGNAGVEVATGRDLCVQASAGRTSGQLVSYTFFWFPPDGQVCGNVLSSSTTAATLSADFGALALTLGSGVASPQPGSRVCYAVEVDRPSGDLIAVRSQPVDTKNEREWTHRCGTVRSYVRATGASSGSIEVGSKGYRIASGTPYTGDPAGDRTDRTSVGSNMCLSATIGDAGEIIEYVTTAMPAQTGGRASEYTPPADGRPGVIVLSYRSHFELKVPAAIANAVDLTRGSHCYTVGVDAAGDAIATAVVTCPTGGVTGPGATPASTPTATRAVTATASPTPSASASATQTPVAVVSPTIAPTATPAPEPPRDEMPLIVASGATLAALAVAAWVISRRTRETT